MIIRSGYIILEVDARPEVRHSFVEAEHLLGNVQLVFHRVDLVGGVTLHIFNQQVVSDSGSNPVGERKFHRNLCLSFACVAAVSSQFWQV